jgi:hypothetical protein
MDVAISRIAEASSTNKKITSDTIAYLFAPSSFHDEPCHECNHSDQGCDWIGTNLERSKHYCQYDLIPCPSMKYGCKEMHERRNMEDHHDYFCRFCRCSCPSCGRDGIVKVNYCEHLEKKCPTYHKNIKITKRITNSSTSKNVGRSGKLPLTISSKWKFTFISEKHFEKAFVLSKEYSTKLIFDQADVKINNAEESKINEIKKLEDIKNKALFQLYEEKKNDKETINKMNPLENDNNECSNPDDVGDGNPYNWDINRLLDYVHENKLKRAQKRKEQAEIVTEFIQKKIEKEYMLQSGKLEKQYQNVVYEWNDKIKKNKYGQQNRYESSKKEYFNLIELE